MSNLDDLYQEVILDHSKNPRNFHKMSDASHVAEGYNPLCGDQLKVYLKLDNNLIRDIGFDGSGCAISKASASLMTASVKDKTQGDVETLFQEFHRMVTGGQKVSVDSALLGKLVAFSGVSEFPVRVKCATLAWHTLRAALAGKVETITTEEGET